jgi:hypothetical protein
VQILVTSFNFKSIEDVYSTLVAPDILAMQKVVEFSKLVALLGFFAHPERAGSRRCRDST